MARSPLLLAVLTLALASPAPAQNGLAGRTLITGDEAHRQRRLDLTGDLGLPALAPLTTTSPLDRAYFADRLPVGQDDSAYQGAEQPVMVLQTLPNTLTGTAFPELMYYQLPVDYDPLGEPVPMIIAYHGLGLSAASPHERSTVDEEANQRGWIYMSPTGLDDQLYGSPVSQQHTEAAVQWMLDNFNVDPDRLYMVGFSMGGGLVNNFAAQRRDPDGIMIAAVGIVGATLDWTQEYTLGPANNQTLMENAFNFGDSPSNEPFAYQAASALHFDTASYPPPPGVIDTLLSMATNNREVPVYITYDEADTIPYVPAINDAFEVMLQSFGVAVAKTIQMGTINPDTGLPATHSWAVLDELELFDFFDGHVVERYPEDFEAQQPTGGAVSWAESTQRRTSEFVYMDATSDPLTGTLTITNVDNATDVVVDVGAAGISGIWPVRVSATTVDAAGFTLHVTGFDLLPSYMRDASTNDLIPLVNSDPVSGSLSVTVTPGTPLDAKVVHNPGWTTVLTTSPNPVPHGQSTWLAVDAPAGAATAWWIFGVQDALFNAKGLLLAVSPAPPAALLPLPLDANGDIAFSLGIPDDPGLTGIRLPWQLLCLDAQNAGLSVSNVWGFQID